MPSDPFVVFLAGVAAACAVLAVLAAAEAGQVGRITKRVGRELTVGKVVATLVVLPDGVWCDAWDWVTAIGLPWPTTSVVGTAIIAVVAAALIGCALGGVVPAVVFAALAAGGLGVAARSMLARRSVAADRTLPVLLDAMARSVRSGSSLHQAVVFGLEEVAAGPLGPETEPLRRALRNGRALVGALETWAASATSTTRRLAVASLSLAAETGGMPARVLDSVAETLRDREALRLEARALSSQARASAVVVAAAPLVFTTLAVGADGRVGDFLFRSVIVWTCLLGGLTLEALGAAWMTWLVNGK